jgi:hypothetical protein
MEAIRIYAESAGECTMCHEHGRVVAHGGTQICESCVEIMANVLGVNRIRSIDIIVRKDAGNGPGDEIESVVPYQGPTPPRTGDCMIVKTRVTSDGPTDWWWCMVTSTEWLSCGRPRLRLMPLHMTQVPKPVAPPARTVGET